MIALDTNVLVRYLVQDDEDQAKLANEVIESLTEENAGYICREVFVEMVWVLERAYGYSRDEIASVVDALLLTTEVRIEQANDIAKALELYRQGPFGFADLLITAAAKRADASELVTFDKQAAKLPDVRLLRESPRS